MFKNFLQGGKVVKLADPAIAATTAVNGASVDTAGFAGVVFLTSLGTAAADNNMKVQQGDTSSPTTDLEGSAVAAGTSDEDLVIEVHKPRKRYLRPVVTRGTSTTVGDIWAILYGANTGQLAANSVSGTQIAEVSASPAEGTA